MADTNSKFIFLAEPIRPQNDFCDPISTLRNGRMECSFGNNVIATRDEIDVDTECQFTCNEGRFRVL